MWTISRQKGNTRQLLYDDGNVESYGVFARYEDLPEGHHLPLTIDSKSYAVLIAQKHAKKEPDWTYSVDEYLR